MDLNGTRFPKGFSIPTIMKGVKEGNFVGIHCIAHIIPLLVRDALGKGDSPNALRDLIEVGRRLKGHFSCSMEGIQLLWISMRWNSA